MGLPSFHIEFLAQYISSSLPDLRLHYIRKLGSHSLLQQTPNTRRPLRNRKLGRTKSLLLPILSSLPDETVTLLPPLMADDFRQLQDLAKRVTDTIQIPLEEVKDSHHKLLDILQSVTPTQIVLPINEVLLDPAKTVWQTPATVLPTCKLAYKKYYVVRWGLRIFVFPHPN